MKNKKEIEKNLDAILVSLSTIHGLNLLEDKSNVSMDIIDSKIDQISDYVREIRNLIDPLIIL
jgi:Na+/phosphate symporter